MTHSHFTWTKPPHDHPEIVIYHLQGMFTAGKDAYELLEEVRAELGAGAKGIVFNLGQVQRLVSAGVGIIAAAFTSARGVRASMRLTDIPPQSRQVLSLVGVLQLVGESANDASAVAELMALPPSA